jgi:hypothetical protein
VYYILIVLNVFALSSLPPPGFARGRENSRQDFFPGYFPGRPKPKERCSRHHPNVYYDHRSRTRFTSHIIFLHSRSARRPRLFGLGGISRLPAETQPGWIGPAALPTALPTRIEVCVISTFYFRRCSPLSQSMMDKGGEGRKKSPPHHTDCDRPFPVPNSSPNRERKPRRGCCQVRTSGAETKARFSPETFRRKRNV